MTKMSTFMPRLGRRVSAAVDAGRVVAPLAAILGTLVLVLACLSAGCSDDPPSGPSGPPAPAQASAEGCMNLIEWSLERRSLTAYEELIPNTFRFYTAARALSDPGLSVPTDWGRADEILAARGLLLNERVIDVRLDWRLDASTAVPGSPTGARQIVARGIEFSVTYRDNTGDITHFETMGTTARLRMEPVPGELASDGQPLWRITHWWDEPADVSGPTLPPASMPWSSIKWLFHG